MTGRKSVRVNWDATKTTVEHKRIPKWWDRNFPSWETMALADSYVWCDEHGEIHTAYTDVYQDGSERCNQENWRPVFVATDEPDEEF